MEEDDLLAPGKAPERKNLEPMSIEELEAFIVELEREIERVRADIAAKRDHLSGAETLFRT
jgi:uncharacterized small protein (DUF1192 family)